MLCGTTWLRCHEGCLTTAYYWNFLRMNYSSIQRMCLLQEEDGCGYSMTESLHVLAERLWNTGTKIIIEGTWENVESRHGQPSSYLKPC